MEKDKGGKMNVKMSESFWLEEYLWSFLLEGYVKVNDTQFWLIKRHANDIMQPIADKFGKCTIISGVRNKEEIDIMKERDEYEPCSATDHAFLDPEVYQFGVGAADFIPKESSILEVQRWIMEQALKRNLPLGQSIIYWNSESEDWDHIHISLLRSVVFQKQFAYDNLNNYGKFLIAFDRGKNGYRKIYLNSKGKIEGVPGDIARVQMNKNILEI